MAKKEAQLSIREFAEALGWRQPKVRKMVKRGKIRHEKIGWFYAIPASEVTRLRNLEQLAAAGD